MKAKIISYNSDNYAVQKADGKYISTFHSNKGIIPILWEKKHNSKESITERVLDIWGIDAE